MHSQRFDRPQWKARIPTRTNTCRRIHETGTVDLGGRTGYITGLRPNSTSTCSQSRRNSGNGWKLLRRPIQRSLRHMGPCNCPSISQDNITKFRNTNTPNSTNEIILPSGLQGTARSLPLGNTWTPMAETPFDQLSPKIVAILAITIFYTKELRTSSLLK